MGRFPCRTGPRSTAIFTGRASPRPTECRHRVTERERREERVGRVAGTQGSWRSGGGSRPATAWGPWGRRAAVGVLEAEACVVATWGGEKVALGEEVAAGSARPRAPSRAPPRERERKGGRDGEEAPR